MAFASLNLAERYRPWRDSGLHFLLRSDQPHPLGPGESGASPAETTPQSTSHDIADLATTATQPQQHIHLNQQEKHISSQGVAEQSQQDQHSAPPSCTGKEWPHPWDCYAAKLPLSPSCIWTYWELGMDMSGQASGHRRTVLQKLLLKLNLPSGSIGFWPAASLHGDELQYDEALFFRGLSQAGAADVLCFGPELFGRLFPGEVYAPRPREAHGYTFHFLPPLRENMADDRPALDALLLRVRSALRIES